MRNILVVLLLVSIALAAAAQHETQPTYVLHGTFSGADNNTYRSLPFEVPRGTHRITIVFSHTQVEQRTVIDLGLYDPDRLRGWSGSDKKWRKKNGGGELKSRPRKHVQGKKKSAGGRRKLED